MFAYHHINAYESKDKDGNGQLIVDVSGYQRPDLVNSEFAFALIHNMIDPKLRRQQTRDARYYRYTLPLSSRSVLTINPTPLPAQSHLGIHSHTITQHHFLGYPCYTYHSCRFLP